MRQWEYQSLLKYSSKSWWIWIHTEYVWERDKCLLTLNGDIDSALQWACLTCVGACIRLLETTDDQAGLAKRWTLNTNTTKFWWGNMSDMIWLQEIWCNIKFFAIHNIRIKPSKHKNYQTKLWNVYGKDKILNHTINRLKLNLHKSNNHLRCSPIQVLFS